MQAVSSYITEKALKQIIAKIKGIKEDSYGMVTKEKKKREK